MTIIMGVTSKVIGVINMADMAPIDFTANPNCTWAQGLRLPLQQGTEVNQLRWCIRIA